MRKWILLFAFLASACSRQDEVKESLLELEMQKSEAVALISAQNWSLESLMKIQNYFFAFSEKTYLLLAEPEAVKKLKDTVKGERAKDFCQKYVVPVDLWQQLQRHCEGEDGIYRCSPDIDSYQSVLNGLFANLGIKGC